MSDLDLSDATIGDIAKRYDEYRMLQEDITEMIIPFKLERNTLNKLADAMYDQFGDVRLEHLDQKQAVSQDVLTAYNNLESIYRAWIQYARKVQSLLHSKTTDNVPYA